ncbi:MAG: M23 family metallopeptidase [Candidatus Rokuibacteriota bacterium]
MPLLGLAAIVVGISMLGALVGDWWQVRSRLRDSADLFRQIEEQQATIDTFNQRLAHLRQEMAGWREMHARIWEPFGPDLQPKARESGIGGRAAMQEDSAPQATLLSELDRFAEIVTQEGQSLRALDRLMSRARKAIASLPSRWPVRGAVNSEYGTRLSPWTKTPEFHGGLDIAAGRGTTVRAPAPGTVAFAGTHGEYGNAVILDHGGDVRTIYGHLSRLRVATGQQVERGAEIALSGNTGRSSGPHLHYEILVKGRSVNPRAYLWD